MRVEAIPRGHDGAGQRVPREAAGRRFPCSTTRSWRCIWRARSPRRQDPRRHPQGHHRQQDGARDLRHLLPQQGRAEAAGRHRGLYARPTDMPAIKGVNPKTDEEEDRRPADDDEPFSALAFKIMTDPYVGRLSFFRVYSGTLTTPAPPCSTPPEGQARAYGPHPADARQPPARISRRSTPATSPPWWA